MCELVPALLHVHAVSGVFICTFSRVPPSVRTQATGPPIRTLVQVERSCNDNVKKQR